MEILNGIEGMNFSPISGYNKFLKNNAAFDIDSNNVDFESILNKQTNAIKEKSAQLRSGIEVNTNLEDFIIPESSKVSKTNNSVDNLLKTFGNSLNGGLNSLDQVTKASDKAQEAFAMGEDISVHDVMIASEKSALGLQMAIQLRNKLMGAYTEINNVRV